MAFDFLDGIPEQFGVKADELFTGTTAMLMLRAMSLSRQVDEVQTLQSRWASMNDKREKGVRIFSDMPRIADRLSLLGARLRDEAITISEAVPEALKESRQMSLMLKHKVSTEQWNIVFSNPFAQLIEKLERWQNPDIWQEDAKLMPPLMSNQQSDYYDHKHSFMKAIETLERGLPKQAQGFTTSLLQLAARGRSPGR